MIAANLQIAEQACTIPSALAQALDIGAGMPLPVLVNVDIWPDLHGLIERSERFTHEIDSKDSLVITILTPAARSGALTSQIAVAGAWAFTRHAALAWAPRCVRLNMIGCGVGQPADPDPVARGRSSAPVHAPPATVEDVVRTVHAIAGWPSMTGQFIRLGGG